MILKEIDKKKITDKYQKSGFEAEKQMAFYLKRAFADTPDIYVINDLRLQTHDDAAQIDHLIIHTYGFIAIESKSVTSSVSVNEHGEWVREYGGKSQGMPSPVQQACRQIDFLKNYLDINSDKFFKVRKLLKANILLFKYDVLVAISDTGIIHRPKNLKLDEVYKADQIVVEIKNIISCHRRVNRTLFTTDVNYSFANTSFEKVAQFLMDSHTPKTTALEIDKNIVDKNITPPTVKERQNSTENTNYTFCKKCNSKDIFIKYGKFGYYFKCNSCDGNSAIKITCESPSCKVKIRKKGVEFFKECSVCKTSEIYFKNSK